MNINATGSSMKSDSTLKSCIPSRATLNPIAAVSRTISGVRTMVRLNVDADVPASTLLVSQCIDVSRSPLRMTGAIRISTDTAVPTTHLREYLMSLV